MIFFSFFCYRFIHANFFKLRPSPKKEGLKPLRTFTQVRSWPKKVRELWSAVKKLSESGKSELKKNPSSKEGSQLLLLERVCLEKRK